MKKLFALLLAVSLVLAISACSDNETDSDEQKQSIVASEESSAEGLGEKTLSDWVDELPDGTTAAYTRNLYRFRDSVRETKEDDAAKLSGWTQYDKRTVLGEWSEWSDSEFAASKNREVETRQISETGKTQYRYGRWYNPECELDNWCKEYSQSLHGGEPYIQNSDWFDTELETTSVQKTCGHSDKEHTNHHGVNHYEDGTAWWTEYIDDSGEKWYWIEDTQVEPSVTKTQYRYRDTKTVYCYERYVSGNGEWS